MPSAASCPSTPTRSQRPWQRSRPSRDHRRGLDSPSLSLPRPLLPGGTRVSSRPRPPGPPQLPHPPKLPLPTVPFSLSNCGPSISDPLAHFWLFSFFQIPLVTSLDPLPPPLPLRPRPSSPNSPSPPQAISPLMPSTSPQLLPNQRSHSKRPQPRQAISTFPFLTPQSRPASPASPLPSDSTTRSRLR